MTIEEFIKVLCFVLIFAAICSLMIVEFTKPDHDFEETTYTVRNGDCLWNLADEYCPDSMNKHDYVNLIIERNGLNGPMIYPGQCLVMYRIQRP